MMNNCINIYTENASYSLSIEKHDNNLDIYDYRNTISITCAPPVFTYPGGIGYMIIESTFIVG